MDCYENQEDCYENILGLFAVVEIFWFVAAFA
jgi:hypothetical protein